MIEEYWNEMFGEFKTPSGKFEIPGFPEHLMSAHFGIKNIIGGKNESMKLCSFAPVFELDESQVLRESLSISIKSDDFWNFQNVHHSEAFSFMERLLPFLHSHSKVHHHYSLKDKNGIMASMIVGTTESSCFIFNMAVRKDWQRRGLARRFLRKVQGSLLGKSTFYWTKHPWLTLNAKLVQNYEIRN